MPPAEGAAGAEVAAGEVGAVGTCHCGPFLEMLGYACICLYVCTYMYMYHFVSIYIYIDIDIYIYICWYCSIWR